MSITKLKRGQTYFYVDSWTHDKGTPGIMYPARVIEIEALTGGAKAPTVVAIDDTGRHVWRPFNIYFDGNFTDNAVWATREEAESAVAINTALQKFFEENQA